MRLVSQLFSSITSSFTEVQGDGKGGRTRSDVYGGSTSEIKSTEKISPSVRVPGPTCDGAVDQGEPTKDEREDGSDTGTFGETGCGEDGGDDGEHALVWEWGRVSVSKGGCILPPEFEVKKDSQIQNNKAGILLLPILGASNTPFKAKLSKLPMNLLAVLEKASEYPQKNHWKLSLFDIEGVV